MIEQGTVYNVFIAPNGSELAEDAAMSDVQIVVEDAYDFEESGGTLEINGEQIGYTGWDEDTNTIYLSSGLSAAATAGDQVLVIPAGESKWAQIQMDDDDDGVQALVQGPIAALLDDGIRDPSEREEVLISDQNGRWEVVALDDEVPYISGEHVGSDDSGTTLVPTTPPAVSPAILTATGSTTMVILEVEQVQPGTSIQYHMSTSPSFTADASTLIGDTQSTVFVAKVDPDGQPLQPSVEYYFATVAYNFLGSAPQSADVLGQINLDNLDAFVTAKLVAGFILTGSITIGQIEITADYGIQVKKPGGGFLLEIPPDGINPITAVMQIVTDKINVLDNLSISGNAQLIGEMQMADGIDDPSVNDGAIHNSWPASVALDGNFGRTTPLDPYWHGATSHHSDSTKFIMAIAFAGSAFIRSYSKATGVASGDLSLGSWKTDFYPWGGIARIGTDYYLLGQVLSDSSNWWIYRVDSATGNVTASKMVATSGTYSATYAPAICTDGTTIYLIWCGSGENTRIRGFNAGLTTETLSATTLESPGGRYSIADAWIDNIDGIGSNRLWVAYKNGPGRVSAFIAGTWATSGYDFKKPTQTLIGMYYDSTATQMITIDTLGLMYAHGMWPLDPVIKMKYAWYDSDATGGTHETMPSPVLSFSGESRAQFSITVPEPPDYNNTDGTNTDKANKVAVYLSDDNWATTYREVFDGTEGWSKTYASFASLATGTPKASNEFTTSTVATPGRFLSTAEDSDGPLIDLHGDGTWRLGPLRSERCYARRYRTGNLAVSSGSTVNIPWGSTSSEDGVTYSTALGGGSDAGWVIQRAAVYQIEAAVKLTSGSLSGRMRFDVLVNGTSRVSVERNVVDNSNDTFNINAVLALDVDDEVTFEFFTNVSGGVTLEGAASDAGSQKMHAAIALVGV